MFARNNDTDGYANTNPMVSSIVELLDKVNRLSSADNKEGFARVVTNTLRELEESDGFGEFLTRFKTNLQKVFPGHPEYELELEHILALKGLVNGRYTSGILINGDFFEKTTRNHLIISELNQKSTVTFTIQEGLAHDPHISFPLTMYIFMGTDVEMTQYGQCAASMANGMNCVDQVFKDAPFEQNNLWLSTRRAILEKPGDIKFQVAFTGWSFQPAIQFLFIDSKGVPVATQAHRWTGGQFRGW